MKLKKISKHLILRFLAFGASVLLGFLSFEGLFVLFPILPIAVAAFGLSVAYEYEVYIQNIKGTWDKLFKDNYQKKQLAKMYLLKVLQKQEELPIFFQDYQHAFQQLRSFGRKHLDKQSAKEKKRIKKNLRDMEAWFAEQLFPNPKNTLHTTEYAYDLQQWLKAHEQDIWAQKLHKRRRIAHGVKIFSLIAGVFVSFGTSYLLMEAFTNLVLLAFLPVTAWPLIILPLTVLAGAAYSFLIYNAVTDMIHNETLQNWYKRIRDDFKKDRFSVRNLVIMGSTLFFTALTVALTICTAGTWWTVAKEAKPLFAWMAKIPSFIIGIINPIITGISSFIFISQNTSESLEMIIELYDKPKSLSQEMMDAVKKYWQKIKEQENFFQRLNPFRWILAFTLTPLRILLFLGHLISIGLTSDRVPGIPEIISALLGIISEAFEDLHYFLPHKEHGPITLDERLLSQGGHSHHQDAPTRLLHFLFLPLHGLASVWDYLWSKKNNGNRPILSLETAWKKQLRIKPKQSITLDTTEHPSPSKEWDTERLHYRMHSSLQKHPRQRGRFFTEKTHHLVEKLMPKEDMKIDLEDGYYKVHACPIGQGVFGTVYAGHYYSFKDEAIVISPPLALKKMSAAESLDKESALFQKAYPDSYVARFEKNDDQYLAMPLFAGQPLDKYLHAHKHISTKQRYTLGIALLKNLAQIHEHGVVHNDLKQGNILFDPMTQKVRIIDFGCSEDIVQNTLMKYTRFETSVFAFEIPPEYLDGTIAGPSLDIYALTSTLAEILGVNKQELVKERIARAFIHIDDEELHAKILNAFLEIGSLGEALFKVDKPIRKNNLNFNAFIKSYIQTPYDFSPYRAQLGENVYQLLMNMQDKEPTLRPTAKHCMNVLKRVALQDIHHLPPVINDEEFTERKSLTTFQ